jgi:hypothetical protein
MRLALAATFLLLSCGVALADPVGHYAVAGANPGGDGKYSGDVSIEKTGDTYKVVWHVGNDTYVGTGIGSKDFIAVSYKSGNDTGLALYAEQSDGSWAGYWTYAGGTKIGTERWVRQK